MKRFVLTLATLAAAAASAHAQSRPAPKAPAHAIPAALTTPQATAPGFTAAQADHGGQVYSDHCASCHGANLNDGPFAPALKGAAFRTDWGGKTVGAFNTFLTAQMPPGQAGVLNADDYADVIAYLLRSGGAPAGSQPLTPSGASSAQVLPK